LGFSLTTGLNNILSLLNPFSDNFILKLAFVPSDGFLSSKLDEIKTSLGEKLNYDSYLNLLSAFNGISSAGLTDVEVDIMGSHAKIIDFSFLRSALSTIQDWARGFFYIFLIMYNIDSLYYLIRGSHIIRGGGATQ